MEQKCLTSCAVLLWIAVGLMGCSSASSRTARATINDVSSADHTSGYKVTAVDGKPVERASSPIHTVIPNALVEPGTRTITVEPLDDRQRKPQTISASFEAGKRYRLKWENDVLTVVEETD